ncbi:hypothetical protein HanOQP8_Chr02g0049711 [Helianthus annuus]|nr:hypothetical protein HanOQP8_Chr02g0049711 [Helianthus annuus]
MENGDDWLAYDKLQHFILCFPIPIIVSLLASRTKYSLLHRRNISIGCDRCVLSLTAGAAKESADELGFFKSASVKDAVADIIGVLVAMIAFNIWNSFCFRDRSVRLEQTRGYQMV